MADTASLKRNITSSCTSLDVISFTLPALMTIEAAEVLAAELRQLPLAEKTHLALDASRLENISTPGVQLILSLKKTLSSRGVALAINGQRDSFIRSLNEMGLGKSVLMENIHG